ncbi:hypothetical protein GCM10010435_64240 [Winogradskya consettensis]|uniref:Uncharacterized protein n=1 Tax=Winogradskya consettensis TaxID=113560 RepID=A0A919SIF8_9ACTN|nr:hypothetical protein [Actinoplanes consettensis]GIM72321.1 hypothetical protein Aco04nite_29720 [Actinoplanes consettensis]
MVLRRAHRPAGPARQRADQPVPYLARSLIGIAYYKDIALGVLNFRSDWIDYYYRDVGAQKRILSDAFAGHGEWCVPAGPGGDLLMPAVHQALDERNERLRAMSRG